MSDIREPGVLERLANNLALLTGAVATLTAAIGNAGVQTQDATAAPKATRQRKTSAGGSTSEAESTSNAPAVTANQAQREPAASGVSTTASQTNTPATTQQTENDDLFGEEEKPAAATDTKKAEPKAKKLTLDDVRAALVAAQTALKSKDKAVALLTEVAGAAVLSKLKEEDFGKLIGLCNDAVAKAPK